MALWPFLPVLAIQTSGMRLVFDQTFSRPRTHVRDQWIFDDGPVYNEEKEKYVSGEGPNVGIHNGLLVITARKEGDTYTSGRLQSRKAWKYGYFELRARLPKGRGTWPAFWLLGDVLRHKESASIGWPKCGEIDIVEQVGAEPNLIHSSLHSENVNWMRKEQRTVTADVPKVTEEFHSYGMDWTSEHIDFYIDGKRIGGFAKPTKATYEDWPFDKPFYVILNLAVGGSWGGANGIDPAIFPCSYEIEYFRVYQPSRRRR